MRIAHSSHRPREQEPPEDRRARQRRAIGARSPPSLATLSPLERLTLLFRVPMEIGVVIGLAYWGFDTGESVGAKVLLGIGAPAVGFGFWGTVDFRQTGRAAEALRLIQELAISGVAALAWYAAGQHFLGVTLAALSVVYHTVVYASGGRLLKSSAGAEPMIGQPQRSGGDMSPSKR